MINLKKNLKDSAKTEFFDMFFGEYCKVPFGTFGKRDIECLLVHTFLKTGLLDMKTNREMANNLGINEKKLKGYIVDARFKFGQDQLEKNIGTVIGFIFDNAEVKINHDGNQYVFVLEDPVLRMDLGQAMKNIGYYTDTSFNEEIVKVRDYALIAFLFHYRAEGDTWDRIQELSKKIRTDEKELLKTITSKKSWLDIGKELIGKTEEAFSALDLLKRVVKLLATGVI